jgi:hypothetical protein
MMLGINGLVGSDGKPSHHVYELRLYHVKEESEANGPLIDHIDRSFMDPTSFSAVK